MDPDPRSEGLYGQESPRPPCVPVSPRPRDKAVSGVPKRGSGPVSCPVPPSGPPEGAPQLDVLLKQVHSLKKVRDASTQELVKAQERREELRQELEQLEQKKEALQKSWQQVQESLKRAQLQGKEMEAEAQRHRGLCLEQHQELKGRKQRWEQLRNRRREQRWQHCQQLEAITEELRHLRITHAPAYLKAELVKLEKMKEKWLNFERRLKDTEEQLGPEGAVLWRLVQEEQEAAKRRLEVELRRQELSRQRRDRLAEELQQLQHSQEAHPE